MRFQFDKKNRMFIMFFFLLGGCATQTPIVYHPPKVIQASPKTPKRSRPQVVAVWIAPYIDKGGNLHGSDTVYTVVQPSQWRNAPIQVREFLPKMGNEAKPKLKNSLSVRSSANSFIPPVPVLQAKATHKRMATQPLSSQGSVHV